MGGAQRTDSLRQIFHVAWQNALTAKYRAFYVQLSGFNPKRPGLFGQLDTRGGAAAAHFRERRLELPNFHFCPQTVFHMKAGIFS